jgi:hypothetical protein
LSDCSFGFAVLGQFDIGASCMEVLKYHKHIFQYVLSEWGVNLVMLRFWTFSFMFLNGRDLKDSAGLSFIKARAI